MRTDILERKEEIKQWVAEGKTKAQMARELNCNPKTINSILKRLDIEYNGNQGSKGLSKPKGQELTLLEYLEKSIDIQSNKVRKKYLKKIIKNIVVNVVVYLNGLVSQFLLNYIIRTEIVLIMF